MKVFAAAVALGAPVAFAAAVLTRQESQTIEIVLQVSKVHEGEAAIDVWDETKSKVLGQSCSQSLQSGLFEHDTIEFKVDSYGAGTFTVGSKAYTVSDDCSRVVSEDELVINCRVPFAAPSGLAAPPSKRDLSECFPHGPVDLFSVMEGFEKGVEDPSIISSPSNPDPTLAFPAEPNGDSIGNTTIVGPLDKRQGSCGVWTSGTHRFNNGNPHQNPWNVQASQPMQCPSNNGCEISHFSSHSVSWSVAAGVTINSWINGEFAVQKSVETGTTYTCQGSPRDYYAVWRKVGTTAYTVRNYSQNQCTGTTFGGQFVLWSPNSNNRRSYYYCVYGKNYVRWEGDRWLDTSPGEPGGP